MADHDKYSDAQRALERAEQKDDGLSTPAAAAGGALGGAAVGTILLGPIGTVIGALAGAVGGGWLGVIQRNTDEPHYTDAHDSAYREHFESHPNRPADRAFDSVRPAYALGHLAARNPDYRGRGWDAVDADLERAWGDEARARYGEWASLRPYARAAYDSSSTPPHGDKLASAGQHTAASPKSSMVGGANSGGAQRGMNSGAVARAFTGAHSGGTSDAFTQADAAAHSATTDGLRTPRQEVADVEGTPRVADANVPSTGADGSGRLPYSDPLPDRAHALDPSVDETQESREKAPSTRDWPVTGG